MALPLLFAGFSGIASLAGFLIKHPFVSKMMIFSIFISLVPVSISFLQDLVSPYVVSNSIFAIASYFGFFDGLNLFISIVLTGFGIKQVLAFVRS